MIPDYRPPRAFTRRVIIAALVYFAGLAAFCVSRITDQAQLGGIATASLGYGVALVGIYAGRRVAEAFKPPQNAQQMAPGESK